MVKLSLAMLSIRLIPRIFDMPKFWTVFKMLSCIALRIQYRHSRLLPAAAEQIKSNLDLDCKAKPDTWYLIIFGSTTLLSRCGWCQASLPSYVEIKRTFLMHSVSVILSQSACAYFYFSCVILTELNSKSLSSRCYIEIPFSQTSIEILSETICRPAHLL